MLSLYQTIGGWRGAICIVAGQADVTAFVTDEEILDTGLEGGTVVEGITVE